MEPGKAKTMASAQKKKTHLEVTWVPAPEASLPMYNFKAMDADEACIRV